MQDQVNGEVDSELALRVDQVRAKFKKRIDRAYGSYASGHSKLTWSQTVAHANRLSAQAESEASALLSAAIASPPLVVESTEDDVTGGGEPAGGESPAPAEEALDPPPQPDEGAKKKRRRRSRKDDAQGDPEEPAAPTEGKEDAPAPKGVHVVQSISDEALGVDKLHASANALIRELVAGYRRAIHDVVKTARLPDPPGPEATKSEHKQSAHALLNLWMTRALSAQDQALARIADWEKAHTAALVIQLQAAVFGAKAAERERISEPYDIVFRRVRLEKLRITPMIEREHNHFQANLQSALRKRIAAIEADASIAPDKKKRGRGTSEAEDEELVAV